MPTRRTGIAHPISFVGVFAALAMLASVCILGSSEANAQATRLIDEIRNHNSGTAVWWTGHNGWLIKSDTTLIATDLILDLLGRLFPSPVSARELADELDILFITHGHGDHFGRETVRVPPSRNATTSSSRASASTSSCSVASHTCAGRQ